MNCAIVCLNRRLMDIIQDSKYLHHQFISSIRQRKTYPLLFLFHSSYHTFIPLSASFSDTLLNVQILIRHSCPIYSDVQCLLNILLHESLNKLLFHTCGCWQYIRYLYEPSRYSTDCGPAVWAHAALTQFKTLLTDTLNSSRSSHTPLARAPPHTRHDTPHQVFGV